jgi:hypothetical protein
VLLKAQRWLLAGAAAAVLITAACDGSGQQAKATVSTPTPFPTIRACVLDSAQVAQIFSGWTNVIGESLNGSNDRGSGCAYTEKNVDNAATAIVDIRFDGTGPSQFMAAQRRLEEVGDTITPTTEFQPRIACYGTHNDGHKTKYTIVVGVSYGVMIVYTNGRFTLDLQHLLAFVRDMVSSPNFPTKQS